MIALFLTQPLKQSSIPSCYFTAILILLSLTLIASAPTCQINPNCFEGCSDSFCVYDPSTNPFYNSSIILADSNTYNGSYCCSGCNSGYFLWNDNITCWQVCNVVNGKLTYGNVLTRTCDEKCPKLYYGDPTTTKCVTNCPENYWVNEDLSLCVLSCPANASYYFTVNRTCLTTCPQGNFTTMTSNNRTICSPTCSEGFYQYHQNMTCVLSCPGEYFGQKGDNQNQCVLQCKQGTYKHGVSRLCQSKCFGKYRYGDDVSGECVSKCPFDVDQQKQLYGDNATSKCVLKCPVGSYAHSSILVCVDECFEPYPIPNYQTGECQINTAISTTVLIIVISSIAGGLIVLMVGSFLVYRFYIKKRLIRKPWTYDVLNDLQFFV